MAHLNVTPQRHRPEINKGYLSQRNAAMNEIS